ncbi:MAG: hypothetical protein NT031_08905, partial [Planctomycetota bacterium]|nr:hypothetical protein [Planctomycetota bacterium]
MNEKTRSDKNLLPSHDLFAEGKAWRVGLKGQRASVGALGRSEGFLIPKAMAIPSTTLFYRPGDGFPEKSEDIL